MIMNYLSGHGKVYVDIKVGSSGCQMGSRAATVPAHQPVERKFQQKFFHNQTCRRVGTLLCNM